MSKHIQVSEVPNGVDLAYPRMGTLQARVQNGVDGAWLKSGDDELGIVNHDGLGPYIMAKCKSLAVNAMPDLVAWHDGPRGLVVQVRLGATQTVQLTFAQLVEVIRASQLGE